MVFLSDALKDLMLNVLDESSPTGADWGSLHTAYSTTGANEVVGGSYARVSLTWAAPGGTPRSKPLQATLPTWNVPSSTTVVWWGGWDAPSTGTFLFMMPLGASLPTNMSVGAADVTANTIQSEAHSLVAGNTVVFWPGSGSGLPAGLTVGTVYYVISAGLTADVFSVSTTLGGSAVDITDEGAGFVQRCQPQTFTLAGTVSLSAGSIDLSALV